MADRIERSEVLGYDRRVKSSLGSALFGLVLFAAAFPLHFWNEGRAVAESQALAEGAGAVVEAEAMPLDPGKEGRLVHVIARASAGQPVVDPQFGLTQPALALERQVEMYQWREHKEKRREKQLGGSEKEITTYTYDKGWIDRPLDSTRFAEPAGHANPGRFPFESQRFEAEPVRLGDFVVAPELARQIDGSEPLPVKPDALPPNLAVSFQADEGALITSTDRAHPQVGDLRVRFERVPEQMVSVIGLQRNGRIEPYTTSNGRSIALVERGEVPAARLFQAAEHRNGVLTWLLRGAGFVLMWIGLAAALGWIGTAFDVLPFLGSLVQRGIGIVAGLAAAALSAVTVAIAWLFHRPLVGIGLLLIAGLALLTLRRRTRPPPPPPGPVAPPPPPVG